MQPHLLPEYNRHQKIQLHLINQKHQPHCQPEFCEPYTESNKQHQDGDDDRADVWKKLADESKYAEHQCRLNPDQPEAYSDGEAGDASVDGDAPSPGLHLPYQAREGAISLVMITIGN